nr:reverse transcriptase domain-containing protein [Tanacetum cinerariifolium]
ELGPDGTKSMKGIGTLIQNYLTLGNIKIPTPIGLSYKFRSQVLTRVVAIEANSAPKVNIQEFCEEHYEDIIPIIMEKVRHDRRKDAHTRLDFGEGPRERVREDSYSNARARASEPGRVKVKDRLKYSSRHVLDRLGHRRQSAFDRLSDTYSPSTTKSRPQRTDSRDSPRGRGHTRTLSVSRDDRHKDRECLRGTRESYGDSFSHTYRDGGNHRHMKRKRDKSPPSSVSRSDSSNGRHRKVRGVTFKPDDFVYRGNDASHAVAGGKLGPKWEGPYEVTEALGNGAYKLRSTDGTVLPRTWNITNLKRCYL